MSDPLYDEVFMIEPFSHRGFECVTRVSFERGSTVAPVERLLRIEVVERGRRVFNIEARTTLGTEDELTLTAQFTEAFDKLNKRLDRHDEFAPPTGSFERGEVYEELNAAISAELGAYHSTTSAEHAEGDDEDGSAEQPD